jgi:hypothetical protein
MGGGLSLCKRLETMLFQEEFTLDAPPAPRPNRPAYLFRRACRECGESFGTDRREAAFCTSPCRMKFQNRRRDRGADLYDLFMAVRYERGLAKVHGIWSLMCRLGQHWRDEDQAERDGRQSWTPFGEIKSSGKFTFLSYVTKHLTRAGR